jgi:transcriptional regulator with XRE-family HTH domain
VSLGPNLRALREKQNISQEELAQAIGVRQSTISEIERGNRTPSLPVANRLAEKLGVSLDALINGSVAPSQEPAHA